MKTWIAPAVAAGLVVSVVVASALVGVQQLPSQGSLDSSTRISVVCPSFSSATADIKVAAISEAQSVRTSKLSAPGKAVEAKGLAVVENPGQPVRVSVPRTQLFGATTITRAEAGPERGLAVANCLSPQSEHWFTGVNVAEDAQASLVLVNLDSTEAVVDLTAYGRDGRLSTPRGLSVEGNSTTTLSLGVIARQDDPITVKVATSQGRVAAFLRQLVWNDNDPASADWVPDQAGAETNLVLPGVPAGKGKRTLVVTNPNSLTAAVEIQMLGRSGVNEVAGAQRLEIPPATTRTVELSAGLGGEGAGLRLASNLPVTAGMVVDNGLTVNGVDAAVTGAAPPIPGDAIWPFAWGKATAAKLQLVNPSDQEAVVQLALTAGKNGKPKNSQVKVPAGTMKLVSLPAASSLVLRIHTDSQQVRGAVVATSNIGKVEGLAVLDLVSDSARSGRAEITFDPHLG